MSALGWSHDAQWLLSASLDGTLRVWSARSREPALCLVRGDYWRLRWPALPPRGQGGPGGQADPSPCQEVGNEEARSLLRH